MANWVNVAALLSSAFLLFSFAILDTKWTHRHYLSICLTASVVFIEVGVSIPANACTDRPSLPLSYHWQPSPINASTR